MNTDSMSPAAKELAILERESSHRLKARDFEWMGENLGSDDTTRYSFPGHETLHGMEVIQPFMDKLLEDENFTWDYTPVHAEVSEDGKLGYVFGTMIEYSSTAPPRQGKYVTTWKKIDGKWCETNLMINYND